MEKNVLKVNEKCFPVEWKKEILCFGMGNKKRGNNGVSRNPSYQKFFWLTENFN